jgi:hypothetical protein
VPSRGLTIPVTMAHRRPPAPPTTGTVPFPGDSFNVRRSSSRASNPGMCRRFAIRPMARSNPSRPPGLTAYEIFGAPHPSSDRAINTPPIYLDNR